MVRNASELVTAALELPLDERIELVERLLQSLDGADAAAVADVATVESAWDAEVARRDGDGDDAFVDGDEAVRALRADIARERRHGPAQPRPARARGGPGPG